MRQLSTFTNAWSGSIRQASTATAASEIALSLKFAPSKSRREIEFSYDVKLKPGPHVDRERTVLYIGKNEHGDVIARPHEPEQMGLPGVATSFDNSKEQAN